MPYVFPRTTSFFLAKFSAIFYLCEVLYHLLGHILHVRDICNGIMKSVLHDGAYRISSGVLRYMFS
jgi:hypothetical protein